MRNCLLFLFLFIYGSLFSQSPLPDFQLVKVGNNKIKISWENPFLESCIQINVQRSYDSLRGFRTIFSSLSPQLPQNGFIDDKAPNDKMFYRIFFMLSNNAYFFSASKRATGYAENISALNKNELISIIKKNNELLAQLPFVEFQKFRDSIFTKTKDSLFTLNPTTVLWKPFEPNSLWRPSLFVYTNRNGSVIINLPIAKEKKYALTVYEEDGKTKVLTIAHITEPYLVLDKTNFQHMGWFVFDLYENGSLKEHNKFYVE